MDPLELLNRNPYGSASVTTTQPGWVLHGAKDSNLDGLGWRLRFFGGSGKCCTAQLSAGHTSFHQQLFLRLTTADYSFIFRFLTHSPPKLSWTQLLSREEVPDCTNILRMENPGQTNHGDFSAVLRWVTVSDHLMSHSGWAWAATNWRRLSLFDYSISLPLNWPLSSKNKKFLQINTHTSLNGTKPFFHVQYLHDPEFLYPLRILHPSSTPNQPDELPKGWHGWSPGWNRCPWRVNRSIP